VLWQAALQALWITVYPGRIMTPENEVEGWKEMGWQGNSPATDFRCVPPPLYAACTTQCHRVAASLCLSTQNHNASPHCTLESFAPPIAGCFFFFRSICFGLCRGGGLLSLENLTHFAKTYPCTLALAIRSRTLLPLASHGQPPACSQSYLRPASCLLPLTFLSFFLPTATWPVALCLLCMGLMGGSHTSRY